MKYFNKITSLENLKDQFRKLALTNHPDKGGNTSVMQEINAEYDVLFPIWKDKVKDVSNDTAQSTRRQFYTEFGWEGKNYNINLRMKDIAKIIRDYAKEKYPTYKFSIRTPDVYSLDISLMEAPENVFLSDNLSDYENERKYIQINCYYIEKDNRLTELCREILGNIKDFAQTYNFDDSDSMSDYYHKNFYLHMAVGKWDKPFKVVEKTARIKTEESKTDIAKSSDNNVTIVDYSEKAIAVYGNTFEIREELNNLGGRFNRNLKGGAGWIFSKKKQDEVSKLIESII